jgi:hypothetical protein
MKLPMKDPLGTFAGNFIASNMPQALQTFTVEPIEGLGP